MENGHCIVVSSPWVKHCFQGSALDDMQQLVKSCNPDVALLLAEHGEITRLESLDCFSDLDSNSIFCCFQSEREFRSLFCVGVFLLYISYLINNKFIVENMLFMVPTR